MLTIFVLSCADLTRCLDIGIYGFSVGIMGAVFICIIIGAGIGLIVYTLLLYFIFEPYTMSKGIGSPEFRLIPGIFAAALAPAGMESLARLRVYQLITVISI
jgi:hypothetical protein